MPHRFAALASVAGGAHPGFAHAPRTPRSEAGSLAVLDLHGKDDDSIPGGPADPQGGAKGWTSDGTWFYEPTATLLGAFGRWQGCVHDPAWGEDWASAVDAGSDALSCADGAAPAARAACRARAAPWLCAAPNTVSVHGGRD